MIVIEKHKEWFKASAYAELTLADFQEFETAVNAELKRTRQLKVLLDFSDLSGYTLDVAWEDVKFTRAHAHDFKRIAVVTRSQWVPWLGWLTSAFTDADIRHFEDSANAEAWLKTG